MAKLCVVRYHGTGVREISQLALCVPRTGSAVDVFRVDGVTTVDKDDLCKAESVDVHTMLKKAHVLAAVERDHHALKRALAGYDEVRSSTRASVASRC